MLVFDTLEWYKGCVTLALSTSNGLGGGGGGGGQGYLMLTGSVCNNHCINSCIPVTRFYLFIIIEMCTL